MLACLPAQLAFANDNVADFAGPELLKFLQGPYADNEARIDGQLRELELGLHIPSSAVVGADLERPEVGFELNLNIGDRGVGGRTLADELALMNPNSGSVINATTGSVASSGSSSSDDLFFNSSFRHPRQIILLALTALSTVSYAVILNYRNVKDPGLAGLFMLDITYDSWRQVRRNVNWSDWSRPYYAAPSHFLPNLITNLLGNYGVSSVASYTALIGSLFSTCYEYTCNHYLANQLEYKFSFNDRNAKMIGKTVEALAQITVGVGVSLWNASYSNANSSQNLDLNATARFAVYTGLAFYAPKLFFEFQINELAYYNRVLALPFLFGVIHLLNDHAAGRF